LLNIEEENGQDEADSGIKRLKRKAFGIVFKGETRNDSVQAEMGDMEGIFGLEKLTEEDIEEIIRTGDIFAHVVKVKPKKKKTIIPKPKSAIPKEMTYWELMDYLEHTIEFGQGGRQ